ncbi:hypothetical protein Tco_0181804, partial [Tanacetum coccineum]
MYSLCLDDLDNTFDVHALSLAVVGNMQTNESQVVSRDYSKLKDDFNQDVDNNQVVKDLRSENARNLDELSMLWAVAASAKDSRHKLSEELDGLHLSVKEVADLERVELVRDLLPLAIKNLFASEHFNHALGDLQQKAISYGRSQALDEVHDLGDSWDFKDV